MKAKVIFLIYSICFFMVISFLHSCDKTPTKEKEGRIITTENADFVVTNITTGEHVKNIGEQDNPDRLTVHNGDILDLSYTPKEGNEQYSWKVFFELFGKKVTAGNAYTTQYPVEGKTKGKYTITCSSEMKEDINDEEFWGLRELGYAYIEIVGD